MLRSRGWASRPRRPRGLSRAASSARATVSSARHLVGDRARPAPIQWSAAYRDHGPARPGAKPAAKRAIRSASSPIAAPAGCRYSGGATSMLTATPTSAPRTASSTRATPSAPVAADLQQQHRADRRLEQVRAEPQHLADHDRAGDDGAQAPPGQPDEVGDQHRHHHPGQHAADAAEAVHDALVEGQLDDQQRHQRARRSGARTGAGPRRAGRRRPRRASPWRCAGRAMRPRRNRVERRRSASEPARRDDMETSGRRTGRRRPAGGCRGGRVRRPRQQDQLSRALLRARIGRAERRAHGSGEQRPDRW